MTHVFERRITTSRVVALILVFVAELGWTAAARATPPLSVIPPPPSTHLVIEGTAIARNASADFECHGSDAISCHVHLRFEIEASVSVARLYVPDAAADRFAQPPRIWVDGRQIAGDVLLAPNQRVTFEMRYTTAPYGIAPIRQVPWIELRPPVDVRHPLLGEGRLQYLWCPRAYILTITPGGLRVEGAVRLDGSVPPGVRTIADDEVLTLPHHATQLPTIHLETVAEAPPVVHGGPVLTLGGLIRTDNAPTRFIIGVGYELSFAKYFILSAWLETDFESIQEAVLLEIASPAVFLVPTVAAGVGAVSTQLGDRDVDGGLRLRATIGWYVLGFIADVDYFFRNGTWNIALGARLSL